MARAGGGTRGWNRGGGGGDWGRGRAPVGVGVPYAGAVQVWTGVQPWSGRRLGRTQPFIF